MLPKPINNVPRMMKRIAKTFHLFIFLFSILTENKVNDYRLEGGSSDLDPNKEDREQRTRRA